MLHKIDFSVITLVATIISITDVATLVKMFQKIYLNNIKNPCQFGKGFTVIQFYNLWKQAPLLL